MLNGKVALVTGCGRGIGKAILEVFARNGATVFANARRPGSIDDLCAGLVRACKVDIHPLYFDVTKPEEIKSAFQTLFSTSKRLDILVNNAGLLADSLLGMLTADSIRDTFAVNTFGPIHLMQYAARLMVRNNSGSIINIASIIGVNGNEGQVAYGGSKAAIIGVTKSAAKELAPNNIRVNAIAPGFIDTDMARSLVPEKFQERLDSVKMKRIGTPVDVANCALFLASDLSSYVTGQVIGVDGGMLI